MLGVLNSAWVALIEWQLSDWKSLMGSKRSEFYASPIPFLNALNCVCWAPSLILVPKYGFSYSSPPPWISGINFTCISGSYC